MPCSTTDRRFLDSDDVANPNDMSTFYRESLMSQAAHRFHGSVKKSGAFKMRVEQVVSTTYMMCMIDHVSTVPPSDMWLQREARNSWRHHSGVSGLS